MGGYALAFGSSQDSTLAARLALYLETLWHDFTPVVPLVALAGAAWLLRRRPSAFVTLVVCFGLTAVFAANFRGNTQQFTIFYLPSFVIVVYAYGLGIGAARRWAGERLAGRPRAAWAATAALTLVLCAVPVYQFRQAYPVRSLDAAFGEPLDIWRQKLKSGNLGERLAAGMGRAPANAVLVGDWEQATVFWYYQKVEGRDPGLEIVYPIERLPEFTAGSRPVCVARSTPLGPEWRLSSAGPLVCLNRDPATSLPAGLAPVGTTLYAGDGQPVLELVGYEAGPTPYDAPAYAPLTLVWRAAWATPAPTTRSRCTCSTKGGASSGLPIPARCSACTPPHAGRRAKSCVTTGS